MVARAPGGRSRGGSRPARPRGRRRPGRLCREGRGDRGGQRRPRQAAHHLPAGRPRGEAGSGGRRGRITRHLGAPAPALRRARLPALGSARRCRVPRSPVAAGPRRSSPASGARCGRRPRGIAVRPRPHPGGAGGHRHPARALTPWGAPGCRCWSGVRSRHVCRSGCSKASCARGTPGRCAGRRPR